MGRANLFILEDQKLEMRFSGTDALTLPRDLFWGPQHAARFIRLLPEMEPVRDVAGFSRGLLDCVWAEGGAVVDFDARVLLLFGGEKLRLNLALRAVYLDVLRASWSGWTVAWASNGQISVAGYVGFPQEAVVPPPLPPQSRSTRLVDHDAEAVLRWMLSVTTEGDGLKLFPQHSWESVCVLEEGPSLVEQLRSADGVECVRPGPANEFPRWGAHIDIPGRTLRVWEAQMTPTVFISLQEIWDGWEVRHEQDAYQWQLDLAAGRIAFPNPDRDVLLDEVRKMLTKPRYNFRGSLRRLAEAFDADTSEEELRLVYDPPTEERDAILAAAFDAARVKPPHA